MSEYRLLLVPDSIYWVTGTIAKSIAAANPGMTSTVISATVLDEMFPVPREIASRFDIVHFLCPYATRKWLPLLQPRMPVVTSHHHVTSWDLVSHNIRGDAIIAGSQEWVDDIVARGADASRVFRVPYGVDVELFSPAPGIKREVQRDLGLHGAGPVVGFFGKRGSNDDDRKGTKVFADAIMRLHSMLPGTGVLIVGPGWQELVSQFRARGIQCAWIPFVEDFSGLPRLYHALDFYWVTAVVEGGPVPLLEAMSSEVCCFSTPVGLAREVVRDGDNAFLLSFGDAAAFAGRTAELWNDAGRRADVGRAARTTMKNEMRWQDTARLVGPAYARAGEVFTARGGGRAVPVPPSAAQQSRDAETIPLDGLDRRERMRASMLESLAWAENLILYQDQRGAAVRLVMKAWRKNPLSARPVRVLLRRFLPNSVVRSVVRIKARLAHTPAAGAAG